MPQQRSRNKAFVNLRWSAIPENNSVALGPVALASMIALALSTAAVLYSAHGIPRGNEKPFSSNQSISLSVCQSVRW